MHTKAQLLHKKASKAAFVFGIHFACGTIFCPLQPCDFLHAGFRHVLQVLHCGFVHCGLVHSMHILVLSSYKLCCIFLENSARALDRSHTLHLLEVTQVPHRKASRSAFVFSTLLGCSFNFFPSQASPFSHAGLRHFLQVLHSGFVHGGLVHSMHILVLSSYRAFRMFFVNKLCSLFCPHTLHFNVRHAVQSHLLFSS